MKVLKVLKHGLICHETFDTPLINELLTNNTNFTRDGSSILINRGSIDMSVYPYSNLVFVIDNDFVPANATEVGGISIVKGSDTRDLYEYYEELDSSGVIKFVKVVKNGDVYTGYGSNDETQWVDRGYVFFPNAETIGVSVNSETPYRLNEIKVYKSEYVTISSLVPGLSVEVYKNGILLAQEEATSSSLDIKLPSYPYTCTFNVYNQENTLVATSILENVWGGDEYVCSLDVELLTLDDIPLSYDIAKHLGNVQNGKIEKKFIIRNNNSEPVVAILRITDYSPFGEWVTISRDYGEAPGVYQKEITVELDSYETDYFWLLIQRPDDGGTAIPSFSKTECVFYLEVV